MRRGVTGIALLLIFLGLELSTEALTLVVERLGTGFRAVLEGAEFEVSAPRFLIGVAGLVLGAVLLALSAWAGRKRQEVESVGAACPQCGNETRRVKRREWQRLLSALLGERLTQRKCDTCGWVGLSLKQ